MQAPYEQLSAAEETAREVFPDASRIRAGWAPASEHPIYVEVWTTNERTGAENAEVYAWQE